MVNFYGIGSQNYSSMFQNLNSSNSGNGGGLYASLGQLKLIQKGGYRKLCKSYYAKEESSKDNGINTASSLNKKQEDKIVAESSITLKKVVSNLSKMDYTKENKSKIEDGVKEFVKNYNSLVSSADDSSINGVTNSIEYLTSYTKANAKTLNHAGITIGSDNQLSIDTNVMKKANVSELKNLFKGSSSFAGRVSFYASSTYTSAVAGNSYAYTQEGNKKHFSMSSLYNVYI